MISNILQKSKDNVNGKQSDPAKKSQKDTVASGDAAQKLLLLTQLSDEFQRDQKLSKQINKIGGDAVVGALSTLAAAISSNKTLHSSLIGLTHDGSADVTPTPTFPSLEKYLEQFPNSLPQLPPILDPKIEKMVFTHVGSLTLASEHSLSYERLEFVGDAYIEIIARRLGYQYFPEASEGGLAQLRQELVNNATLAQFSFQYGFDERLTFPQHFIEGGAKDFRARFQKMFGDVFEAYAAALVETDPENGFHVLERWLMALWKPRLLQLRNKVPMDDEAKTKLAQKLGGKGIRVNYVDEREEVHKGYITYTVGVYIDGWGWQNELLGTGEGQSKKEAGMWAATNALTNPTTAVIAHIKKEFDIQVAAERAKEGGPDPKRIEMLEAAFKGVEVGF